MNRFFNLMMYRLANLFSNKKRYAVFNNINSHVAVADNNLLDITTNLTVECWIYRTSYTSGHGDGLIHKGGFGFQGSYILGLNNGTVSTSAFFRIRTNDSNYYNVNTLVGIPLSKWTHIAGTYDGTSLKIYINGVLSNSLDVVQTISVSTTALIIGSRQDQMGNTSGTVSYFGGFMSNAKVWNRALTEADINLSKSNHIDLDKTGLVAWWKLDNNAKDSSGNNLNGTTSGDLQFDGKNYPASLERYASFKSLNNYIQAGNIDADLSSFTFECWVKIGAQPSTDVQGYIVINSSSQYLGNSSFGLTYNYSLNRLEFYCGGSSNPLVSPSNLINDGKWHHIAVMAGANGGYRGIWVDFTQRVYVSTSSQIPVFTPQQRLCIGGGGTIQPDYRPFNGEIANVKLWNKQLNQGELLNSAYSFTTTPQYNVVGNWPVDGSAKDTSGKNNNGTEYGGVKFITPETNNYANFFAQGNFATFSKIPDITNSSYSVEFRIRINSGSTMGVRQVLILGDNTANGTLAVDINLSSMNEITNVAVRLSPYSSTDLSNSVAMTRGEWYHICFTFDMTTGRKMFVNGVLVKQDAFMTPLSYNTTSPFYKEIGYRKDINGRHLSITDLSNIRIWNKALTDQEVKQAAVTIYTGAEPNLLVSYRMNGNLNDSSGNNNHLIKSGNVTLFED